MKTSTTAAVVTPPRIALLTVCLPLAYVITIGPERFYYESWGTWLLSPIIYTRITPSPLSEWLLREFCRGGVVNVACFAAPVLMLFVAAVMILISIQKNSNGLGVIALALTITVFAVYHFLQPLGVSYILF